MALTELTALETAYHVLEPLDEAARRRALQWLSDALGEGRPLAGTPTGSAETAIPAAAAIAAQPQPRRRRRATATAKATPAKPRARKRQGRAVQAQSASGGERAYRRMPDPKEIMAAYAQVGTVSGLADHFDVPKHTVHHWARRLRGQGYLIGRGG